MKPMHKCGNLVPRVSASAAVSSILYINNKIIIAFLIAFGLDNSSYQDIE
jgi:hypothetical protein